MGFAWCYTFMHIRKSLPYIRPWRPRAPNWEQKQVQLYSFFNLGIRLGWVVNSTPLPLNPGKIHSGMYWPILSATLFFLFAPLSHTFKLLVLDCTLWIPYGAWTNSILSMFSKHLDIWIVLIYLLTAIVLTPGDSSTIHIYTQILHRRTQLKTLVGSLSGIRTQSGQIKINDELTP
jgi:hypothetical protein